MTSLSQAQTALMRATRSGHGVEQARKEFETLRALKWIEKNRDKLLNADLDKIVHALTTLEDNR